MTQSAELEVLKRELARVKDDLGISRKKAMRISKLEDACAYVLEVLTAHRKDNVMEHKAIVVLKDALK